MQTTRFSHLSILDKNIPLALAYFVAGYLGLLLAIPPGYATSIWPPSGIALAAMLLLGRQCWPGVWFGSLAINMYIAPDDAPLHKAFFIAAAIATGSTLQVLFSSWMIRRKPISFSLATIEDIRKLLLLGGPLGCLVASSIGITALWFSGQMAPAAAIANWFTWWVGDTIGVMVFTPILLLAFGEGHASTHRKRSVALTLFLTFVLHFYIFALTLRMAQNKYVLAHGAAADTLSQLFTHMESPELWFAMLGGMLFTGLSATLALLVTSRSDTIAQKVKEQTHKIAAREEQFRMLIDNTPAAVAMLDREMRFIITSKRWMEDYRLLGREIIGLSLYDVFPDIRRKPEWVDAYRRALAGEIITSAEEEWVREDATRHWLNYALHPWRDAKGDIAGIIIFSEVISERKQVEQRLQFSEEYFRQAMLGAPIPNAIVRLDGGWEVVNNALCELLGYTKDELHRLDFQSVTHPDDLERDLSYVGDLVAGKIHSYQIEKRYIRKNGEIIHALLSVTLTRYADGTPRVFISQIQDITAHKEALVAKERLIEELVQSNMDLERFAYVCSHDLQEPLRSIANYVQKLERTSPDLNDVHRLYFRYIRENAIRARALIQGLLEYSRLHHSVENPEHTDMSNTVAMVLEQLDMGIQSNSARVQVGTLPVVQVPPLLLQQLLMNLIVNALKFRRDNVAPEVSIDARELADAWEISVSDNGIGIAEEHRESIFSIFQKLHNAEQFAGLGIGLAICKRIAERIGGSIRVESTLGQGSTFSFTIPKPNALTQAA